MKLKIIAIMLVAACSFPAYAQSGTDALGACLADSTTGKDRKDLAKWVFVGMGTHPEIQKIAKPSDADVEVIQQRMGALVTRLMADDCAKEMRTVVQQSGTEGVKVAFEYLGRFAMQELMTNQEVATSMGRFERYIDKSKVEKSIKPQ